MDAADIPYTIRRSDRARRVRITVDHDHGIVVVLPRRAAQREAVAAVRMHTAWIRRRLAELDAHRAVLAARGDTLPYLDDRLTLVPEDGRTRAHRRAGTLLVPADPAVRTDAIERWYRRAARTEIVARVDAACAQTGARYTRLTIRGQRTRWGSCTRDGALSFNWRLLLAPDAVLMYVVWHELCHLQAMDHSPRFWALVAAHCPDYARQRTWLRRHGATLVL